jgi:hypothetical protein
MPVSAPTTPTSSQASASGGVSGTQHLIARRARLYTRGENADLSVPAGRGSMHHDAAGLVRQPVQRIARREIVAGIDQDLARLASRRRQSALLSRPHIMDGSISRSRAASVFCLQGADFFIRKLNLPLKVRAFDPVVVPEFDFRPTPAAAR